ncbi:SusC/RagA family TonB-linked outer membrane protein [Marinifilum flexuosum]|uniref:TonB-linked SusC/RagA family outer membrane protein n=1 Tax=Marinifilum flexuosum TaxID=1117708 RepID=A0A419X806_9BACT|nr:SusC/RagA family TonB-linked outer membrane protein [Marinifilum flexuosum]RKE03786.1 TonB-linked SusC/RagA family outer membrane protein [Marinifilum flexuosum]
MKKSLVSTLILMFIGLQGLLAQSREVSGIVTSAEDGLSIPGVSVIVKGTTIGTSTDFDGKYSINVPEGESILVFSFVGMTAQELAVKGSTMNVVMQPASVDVDEVMVVAYGTAKKESFTGSASVVKKDDIVKVSGGIGKVIQGKVAGVTVMGGDIRIRGFGSFSASSSPLYVVDGVVGAPKPNDEDIENFTVLKDAASTALYGSRGANGVIIITSKKGKKDKKPTFEVKYQHSVEKMIEPEWELMNAGEYYQHQFKGMVNYVGESRAYTYFNYYMNNKNPYNMAEPFNLDGSLKEGAKLLYDTNWKDEALENASKDEIYVAASGGSENSNYHWSARMYKYDGFVRTSKSKGANTRFNYTIDLRDNLKVNVNSTISYYEGSGTYTTKANENNHLYLSYVLSPAAPMYQLNQIDNGDGTHSYEYVLDKQGNRVYDYSNPNYKNYNPIGLMEADFDDNYGFSAFFAPSITYEVIDGLTLKGQLSGRLNTRRGDSFQNPYYGSGSTENGLSTKETYHTMDWTMHTSANYKFEVGDDHSFDVIVGYEAADYDYQDFYATKNGYSLGDISTELSTGNSPRYAGSSTTEVGLISYLSNLNYDFRDKYYMSASFRRDGSSKFGEDNKWGNFWSVGFSWRISEENFLSADWITNLKLRTSYGVLGTNDIGNYKFGDYYSLGANYGGITGVSHTNLPNAQLGWEESDNFSVGVDFDLFDSKLSGTIEYFNKNTDGLLYNVPLPTTTGFPSVLMNIGEMQNSGFEMELSGKILSGEFNWNADLTMTYIKNEIKSLPVDQVIQGTKRWIAGDSRYEYYIREWAGVDPEDGRAQWYMDQENADGTVEKVKTKSYSKATRYNMGQSTPKFFFGLNNNLSYKGFDFSVQTVAAFGHKIYDGQYQTFMHDGSGKATNLAKDALNSWTPENTNTDIPKYRWANNTSSNSTSSRWLVDGDFVKIKNITLGYTVPERFLDKMFLNYARVFMTVDNVHSFSDYKSGDPEISLAGVSNGYSFNPATTYRMGINIKF